MINAIGQVLLVLLALALVVGMIFGAAFLARRFGGLGVLGATQRVRTVAVASVGQRERVVLLEVNGVQLLVGVAAGSVRTLREFPAGSFVPAAALGGGSSEHTGDASDNASAKFGQPMPFKAAFALALKRSLGQQT